LVQETQSAIQVRHDVGHERSTGLTVDPLSQVHDRCCRWWKRLRHVQANAMGADIIGTPMSTQSLPHRRGGRLPYSRALRLPSSSTACQQTSQQQGVATIRIRLVKPSGREHMQFVFIKWNHLHRRTKNDSPDQSGDRHMFSLASWLPPLVHPLAAVMAQKLQDAVFETGVFDRRWSNQQTSGQLECDKRVLFLEQTRGRQRARKR
jgi:hypothetical protein